MRLCDVSLIIGFIVYSVFFISFFSSLFFIYKEDRDYKIKNKEIERRIWNGLWHEIDRADRRARYYFKNERI